MGPVKRLGLLVLKGGLFKLLLEQQTPGACSERGFSGWERWDTAYPLPMVSAACAVERGGAGCRWAQELVPVQVPLSPFIAAA